MTTLFTNVTALLMDEGFTTLRNGFVAVNGTNISYVGTERPAGDFDQTIDCNRKVMMPGFVNCHTHIPMTLMRGYGGGHDLQSSTTTSSPPRPSGTTALWPPPPGWGWRR